MSFERVDVAVVGLGPAGARAAHAAAAGGCSVLALDRRRECGVPVQCAELVPGLIGQDGAAIERAVSQSISSMRTRIEDGPMDRAAPFPGHIIDRRRFDAEQVAAAGAQGARCRLGVTALAVDPAGRLRLSDGTRVEARVIIGADGPRSRVGRAIGAANSAFVHARQFSVALRELQGSTDIFLGRDLPGGYGWLFPKGGRAHLGAGVDAAARGRLPAILDSLYADLHARGVIGERLGALTGGLIPVGGPRRAWGIRDGALTLLAGDAAGLTNPVTGAGIHAALVSGEAAGDAALAWLAGDATAGADYAEDLDELFGRSLRHALARRAALASVTASRVPSREDWRRAWIAYPEYWSNADHASCAGDEQEMVA